ncbi:MAG: hypothetical protein H0W29_05705 [Gemmatimonadales bacterium]|nr:hypothetical protein [Gemmatimonadales bacterium]
MQDVAVSCGVPASPPRPSGGASSPPRCAADCASLFGVVLGLAGAAALTRLLRAWLFGVSPLDPTSLVVAAAVLAFAAVLASWPPARRAMRVDPMVALRYE